MNSLILILSSIRAVLPCYSLAGLVWNPAIALFLYGESRPRIKQINHDINFSNTGRPYNSREPLPVSTASLFGTLQSGQLSCPCIP